MALSAEDAGAWTRVSLAGVDIRGIDEAVKESLPPRREALFARDERAAPRSPLDNVRSSTLLPRINGMVTLASRDAGNGWRLDARAGRSREANIRGLVAGVRYAPTPTFEVAPLELRVGRQADSKSPVSVGARISMKF